MRLADSSGPRSGLLFLSIGVGTATTMTSASVQRLRIRRRGQTGGLGEIGAFHFQRSVVAGGDLPNSLVVHVEADRCEVLAELDGKGQPDVAEADNRDDRVFVRSHRSIPG